jgi:class 3 adenylate cyclase
LSYGIGIHCGPAVVGPVGTSNRIDYTAIGPTINLAARLQSLTKDKRVDILISSELYSLVQSATLVSDLGATKVQGIDKPVGVFRLLGAVDRKGQFHFYDNKLEAANLPHGPGTNDQAPENLFKAS